MKAKGHSLWLMPSADVYDTFARIIGALGAEYNAPLFEPHVSLLGVAMHSDADVLRRTEQLASGYRPFPIKLRTVDHESSYFRTLFVKADRTDQLQALHDRAKEVFGVTGIPEYMPHVSLMYGNFPDTIKENIIKTIGRDQSAQFTVKSIHLFKTDGDANSWHRVKEIPFADTQ